MLRAKEDSSEERGKKQQPLPNAMSRNDAHTPSVKQICSPFIGFTQPNRQKFKGGSEGTTSPQRAQERKRSSTPDRKDDYLNPLWEPCIVNKDYFQVPDHASNTDFPPLIDSKAAVKKKL